MRNRLLIKYVALVLTRGGVENTRLEAKDTKKSEAKDTKKSEAKAKDSPSEDKPSRGQGPRTQDQGFSKKKFFKNFFQAISKKKSSKIFFRRS